jgi:hypothetical protein
VPATRSRSPAASIATLGSWRPNPRCAGGGSAFAGADAALDDAALDDAALDDAALDRALDGSGPDDVADPCGRWHEPAATPNAIAAMAMRLMRRMIPYTRP